MVSSYHDENIPIFNKIIEDYKQSSVQTEEIDIYQLLTNLKSIKKCPAIVFQPNSTSCMRLVRQLAKQIETKELENILIYLVTEKRLIKRLKSWKKKMKRRK